MYTVRSSLLTTMTHPYLRRRTGGRKSEARGKKWDEEDIPEALRAGVYTPSGGDGVGDVFSVSLVVFVYGGSLGGVNANAEWLDYEIA